MVTSFDGAILAAGAGERLRPAVGPIPKPLVAIGGTPMLLRQAAALRRAGARSVTAVISSESARQLEAKRIELPGYLRPMVRDTANSMESLFALAERIASENFLLATVDALVAQGELDRFVAAALEVGAPGGRAHLQGALALVRWRGDRKPLFAALAPDGAIAALGPEMAELVTAGFYFLPRRIFDFIGEARAARLDALRRFLSMLVDGRMRLLGVEIQGAIDIDEGADLAAARMLVEAGTK